MHYISAISNPTNENSLIIGTTTGILIEKKFNDSLQEIAECIIDRNLRSIQKLLLLSRNEIIILCQFSIHIYNCETHLITRIHPNYQHKNTCLLVLNENNLIVFGMRGLAWNLIRSDHSSHFSEMELFHFGDHAHFCAGLYNQSGNLFIANNYNGESRIFSNPDEIVRSFETKVLLESTHVENQNIFGSDYYGNLHLFHPSTRIQDKYDIIETIDCESISRKPSIIKKMGSFLFCGYEHKIWQFNLSLTDRKVLELNNEKCKDIIQFKSNILILTNLNVIFPSSDEFVDSDDYLDFKFINIGILGNSNVGKSSLSKKICTGLYVENSLGTTTSVLNWIFNLPDEKSVFFIDIPGQPDIVKYYLPEFSSCQLVLILIEKRNSPNEIQGTFQRAINLFSQFPSIHFIIVRTKCDETSEIISIEDIKQIAEEILTDIPYYDEIIEVSARKNDNIDELKSVIQNHQVWNNACHTVKSKISKEILDLITLRTGMGREELYLLERDSQGETLEELLKGEEHILSETIITNACRKLHSERRLHLLEPLNGKIQILLKTELLAKVQSRIITKFSLNGGFMYKNALKDILFSEFSDNNPDTEEKIEIFMNHFIKYLIDNSFMKEIAFPDKILIFFDFLRSSGISNNSFSRMSFKFHNPIDLNDILKLFLPTGKIEKITESECLILYADGDKIILKASEIFQYNTISNISIGIHFESNLNDKLFEKSIHTLSDFGFREIPDLDSEYEPGTDYREKVKFCINNPSEGPFWDFKEKRNVEKVSGHQWNESAMKFLKSVVSLGNSGIYNNNESYLLIGVGEIDHNSLKIINVDDIIMQEEHMFQIANIFLSSCSIIPHRILISDIKQWYDSEEIKTNLIFDSSRGDNDQILFLIIKRFPNTIIETKKIFKFAKNSNMNIIQRGWSSIRSFSFSYGLTQVERNFLLGR
jgi:GTP-binding protein EngB required for normal cell division